MSWLFSRALVADLSPPRCLDGTPFALWSWMDTASAFSSSDKMTESYDPVSRYGMTLVPLTVDRGEGWLMSSLEDFLVKRLAQRQLGGISPMIYGRKCGESSAKQCRDTYLPRTSRNWRLTGREKTLSRWVTKPKQYPLARKTWVAITYGPDIGYLHTPTTRGNYCAESMQKWPSCRMWAKVFGQVTPEIQEWLMGWPIGWTGLKPLAMDRYQSLPLMPSG